MIYRNCSKRTSVYLYTTIPCKPAGLRSIMLWFGSYLAWNPFQGDYGGSIRKGWSKNGAFNDHVFQKTEPILGRHVSKKR